MAVLKILFKAIYFPLRYKAYLKVKPQNILENSEVGVLSFKILKDKNE